VTEPVFSQQPVKVFLDRLATRASAPAGGCAAALVIAQSAALCSKAARLSARQLVDGRAVGLRAEAERIRTAATALIDQDAQAVRHLIELARRARDPDELAAALAGAADVPMCLIELAAGVADLAAVLAEGGNPALRGDVITAALLAEAAGRAAAVLVGIDLAAVPDDPRHQRAADLLAATPTPPRP